LVAPATPAGVPPPPTPEPRPRRARRKCKEVRCRPANFADGYGQWLERSNVCYDDYSSVVVMVTDTCPCYYPNNWYSNKR
jgi:hypothetical protein